MMISVRGGCSESAVVAVVVKELQLFIFIFVCLVYCT